MIAVGTPPGEDGSADLSYVLAAARGDRAQPARATRWWSTRARCRWAPATASRRRCARSLAARGAAIDFAVVSNPEFLKEGAAIEDFTKPDRIVLGIDGDARAEAVMRELYAPFQRNHDRTLVMGRRSAELTKYAANAMLATRISFMNELANLAERAGADIEDVRRGIGSDPRIGFGFLYSGTGYGGSCFPKDVKALVRTGRESGMDLKILEAVEDVNDAPEDGAGGQGAAPLRRRWRAATSRSGAWRSSPTPTTCARRRRRLSVIEALLAEGATVAAFDPVSVHEAKRTFGERAGLAVSRLGGGHAGRRRRAA